MLPKVVGDMKTITVREVRDKKPSRDVGTAKSPVKTPEKSEETMAKTIQT